MLFSELDGQIWMDGKMLPWQDAKVHVLTHGMHYASCVFEGLRSYNGKPFKLNEHSERLRKSAEILGFEVPYSADELDAATFEVLKTNNLMESDGVYIRPVAWRGSEKMGISVNGLSVHVAIAAWDWGKYFNPELYEKGLSLGTSSWRRPAPDTAPVQSKAAGLYMICSLSRQEAEKKGFDDALMLDYRGFVAEATGANIFVIKNGEIHTPLPECFLNGITRQMIIKMSKSQGITVIERHIKPEELASADEVFITGSAAEVAPVCKIDDHTYPVGNITKLLMTEYKKLILSG